MVVYFKYKIKNLIGYQKIIQKNNIKFLEKYKVEGYNHMFTNNGYVYFSIENKLYRLLKLSYLDNQEMEHQMKSLDIIIKSSIRTEKEDIPPENFSWFKVDTCEYFNNEKSLQRAEHKERIRNHNNYYNQKYKLKK